MRPGKLECARLLTLAALTLGGCLASSTPGTFHVTFVWPDGPPTFSQPVYVFAEVDDDSVTPAAILQLAGPIEYSGTAITLPFGSVPNGHDRVVVIRIQQTSSSNSQVYYYGKSSPFSVEPGSDVDVPVNLMLQLAPGAMPPGVDAGTATLSTIAIVSPVTPGYVSCGPPPVTAACPVQVVLTTTTGVSVKLANELGGVDSANPQPIPPASDAGSGAVLTGWDLNAGLSDSTLAACDYKTAQQGCPRTVYAEFVDQNGFVSPVVFATISLDAVPPGFANAGTAIPAVAGLGQVETLTLTANEPLLPSPLPELTLTGPVQLMFSATGAGTTFTYSASIPPLDPMHTYTGVYTDTLAMTDLAGNTASLAGPAFTVDTTSPLVGALVNGRLEPAVVQTENAAGEPDTYFSTTPGYDDVVIVFDVSKPVEPPEVSIGSLILPDSACTATPAGSNHYVCAHMVTGMEPETSVSVSVRVTDAAGNSGEASGTVTFDFTPPKLLLPLGAEPPIVGVGQLEVLTLTPSEPLQPGFPQVVFDGPLALATQTGTAFELTIPAAPPVQGTETTSVQLVDLAGNPATVAGPSFAVDTVVPAFTAQPVTNAAKFSAVAPYNDVKVTLALNKMLTTSGGAPELIATLAGVAMTCSSGCTSSPGTAAATCVFDYQVTDTTTIPEGYQLIQITAVDEARNSSTASVPVTLDYTAPSIVLPPTLNYVPAAGNVLGTLTITPTAATAGTDLRLSFTVSEPLGLSPMVTSEPAGLAFAQTVPTPVPPPAAPVGTSFVFDALMGAPGSPPDGAAALSVSLTDVVGNAATWSGANAAVAIPTPQIMTVAPAPPDTSAGGPITYTRIPWGSSSTVPAGVPTFAVAGGANAGIPGGTVLALDGPVLTADIVGHAAVAGDGSFDLTLAHADRLVVYLVTADEAGNESEIVAAHNVSWTASFNGKIAGNSAANPNMMWTETSAQFTGGGSAGQPGALLSGPLNPWTGNVTELGSYQGLFSGAASPSLTAGAPQWVRASPSTVISGYSITQHALAYDSGRGVTVSFGGYGSPSSTWEWDGTTLNLLAPEFSPPQRVAGAMAFDARRGVTVLFGGAGLTGNLNDTWEWNGTTWTQVFPESSPPPRHGHSMAYDLARGVTVLFGGDDTSDTWEWNGVAWNQSFPSTSPPGRVFGGMAYDAARGVSVLFGGQDSNSDLLNDTWEWSGAAWTQVSCAGTNPCSPMAGPSARAELGMAYDTARGVSVLFGGAGAGGDLNDTWEWNGLTWVQVSCTGTNPCTADGSPPARHSHAMVYDSLRGETVLLWGNGFDDLWELNGSQWTQRSTASPPGRMQGAEVFDTARGVTVLFGGTTGSANVLNDTWESNGTSWTQVACAGSPCTPTAGPPARDSHAMAYDAVRGVTVLFGGYDASYNCLDDTWEWDGSSWTQMTPLTLNSDGSPGSPASRVNHRMVFDQARGVSVMFGGYNNDTTLDDTWEWNGTTWTEVSPAQRPPSRGSFGLAYDVGREVTVLFGGLGPAGQVYNDTWEWNGAAWTQLSPAQPPAGRWGAGMAYDAARGASVLFCGADWVGQFDDTWEWDGATWTEVSSAVNPAVGPGTEMAYDSARGTMVAFGGQEDPTDTWYRSSSTQAYPAEIAAFDFSATGEPLGGVALERLGVRLRAGGTDYSWVPGSTGSSTPGSFVAAWDTAALSGWRVLGTNAADSTAPAELSYTTTSAWEAATSGLIGPLQTINFAVAPIQAAGNGPAPGEVAVGAPELTAEYIHSESPCTLAIDGGCLCASDEIVCGAICSDISSDSRNCGGCLAADAGTVCTDGTQCIHGACACPGTEHLCAGACSDTTQDRLNCGGCSSTEAGSICGPGETCTAGVCSTSASGCSAASCLLADGGPSVCNTATGQCAQCNSNADCACQTGATDAGACPFPATPDCNSAGTCVQCLSDGECANGICVSGTCQSCPDAGTNLEIGCSGVCTNTAVDPNNCGNCGTACPSGRACSGGVCQ